MDQDTLRKIGEAFAQGFVDAGGLEAMLEFDDLMREHEPALRADRPYRYALAVAVVRDRRERGLPLRDE